MILYSFALRKAARSVTGRAAMNVTSLRRVCGLLQLDGFEVDIMSPKVTVFISATRFWKEGISGTIWKRQRKASKLSWTRKLFKAGNLKKEV
jgi:hypothetical protein